MQNLLSNYTKPDDKLQSLNTGWGTWIRTKIDEVKVSYYTIKLFPNKPILLSLADSTVHVSEKNFMIVDNKER